jgi:hypothetical protein
VMNADYHDANSRWRGLFTRAAPNSSSIDG